MDPAQPWRWRSIVFPTFLLYALAWIPFLASDASRQMVRLQLAGSKVDAQKVIDDLSSTESVDLAFLVGLDHVHLLLYGVLLIAATGWARTRLRGPDAGMPRLIIGLVIAGVSFDLAENLGLILMMRGMIDDPVPLLTRLFSMAKFASLLGAIAYVMAGVVARRPRAR